MALERVSSLESELQETRTLLQEKERDLITAAEFGKRLLDTNQELHTRLEELGKEYAEKIEALEQDKYSLQLKVDCQKSTIDAIQHEVENTRSHLEHEHTLKQQRLEEVYSKKVHDATSLNKDLKSEIERLEVQVKNNREKVQKQEEVIEKLNEELKSSTCGGNTTFFQHELKDLEQMVAQEKAHSEELQMQLLDSESNVEMLQMETSTLSQKVEALEEECEERSHQANTWYQALQEAKEQNMELSTQMEAMKLEMMGAHYNSTGNSLFGEVEDRRMDAERKLISLQVKYDTLEKTHFTVKQQMKKMKAEMSALLCQYSSTSADASHAQRLQQALEQSKSETQTLLNKLHKLERQQSDVESFQKQKYMAAFTDFGDKREYIQFLEKELEQAKRAKEAVGKELEMKRMKLLWENNKLSEMEAKLHQSEQERAKLKKEATKLKLRLQETTEKLDAVNTTCKQLEGDNKFLEEQLKSRGRRSIHPSQRTSLADSCRTSQQGLSDKSVASSSLDVSSGPNKPVPDGTQKEEISSSSDVSDGAQKEAALVSMSSSQPPKKEINILEDLEMEFNKQKAQVEMAETQGPASFKSNMSSLRMSLGSENLPAGGGKDTSNCPPLQPKVIHVKKPNVNQCPQQ